MATDDPLDRQHPELLLVDDAEYRDVLAQALRRSGLALTVGYRTAREAIAQMEVHPAAVVLMDVSLAPDDSFPNGCLALLEILRRWPETKSLLLTGWGQDDVAMQDCPKGARVFTKPFEPAQLVLRVRDLCVSPPWVPQPEV
jgi:ActR/RegA family two-component response regulator